MEENLPDTLTPVVPVVTNPEQLPNAWGRLIPASGLMPVDIVSPRISFGRLSSCDIVAHPKLGFKPNLVTGVSKEHFVIQREGPVIYLQDNSKNGTYINGRLVGKNNRNILRSNDYIAVSSERTTIYIFKSYLAEDKFLPASMTSKYYSIKELGRGACGEVRAAMNTITCEEVAIKKIVIGSSSMSNANQLNHSSRIEREISILKSLSHPCIIAMKEIECTEAEVFIVLEYMKGGELTNRILSNEDYTESNVKFLFYQMILAVQYLHAKGVTHRDLKPENILLLSDEVETLVKLTDFGLSKDVETMVTMCGTLTYVAPEVINPRIRDYGEYGKAVDVWSLGVILFYMLSKNLPFRGPDRNILVKQIVSGSYSFEDEIWKGISAEAKDLIRKMLVVNPKKRIPVEGVLRHPWISRDLTTEYRVHSLLSKHAGFEWTLEYLNNLGPPEKKFKFSHTNKPNFFEP